MAAPAMKVLRISLVDLSIVPAGPGGTVSGEVWAKLSKQVRTVDGQVVVLAAARKSLNGTGIVEFSVPANNDTGIHADDRGFGIVVGWDLSARGSSGSTTKVYNAGTTVLVTSAASAVVAYSSLAPAVPTDALVSYPTDAGVDAKIAAAIAADNTLDSSIFAPAPGTVPYVYTTTTVLPSIITGTHTRGYDRKLSVYNLKPKHLYRTRAAMGKARAGTGTCNIATLGDSTTVGFGAVIGTEGWPEVFRDAIATGHGTGWCAPSRGTPDPRWSIGAGFVTYPSSTLYYTLSGTAPIVFTSTTPGTIVRLYYSDDSVPFNVSIDGGAVTLLTPGAAGTPFVRKYEVSGLANTTHSISATPLTGKLVIYGAEVTSSANGVRLMNTAYHGSASNYYQTDTTLYNACKIAAGTTTGGFGADLVLLDYGGINDEGSGRTVAQFKASLIATIPLLTAQGADLVLTSSNPYGGSSLSGMTTALVEIADELDLPLVDFRNRLIGYTEALANGAMFDAYHPTKFGYAIEARQLVDALAL